MEKLIEKAKEQNEEIERQQLLLELNEKVLFDKEKELQAKFDEIAELRMKLDEEEKQRREEVRRFQSQLQSAEDYAMRLASEKHRAEQFEKELILLKASLDSSLRAASTTSVGVGFQPSNSLASAIATSTLGTSVAASAHVPGVSATIVSSVYTLPISNMSLYNTTGHNVSTTYTLSTGTETATVSSTGMPPSTINVASANNVNTTTSTSTTTSTTTSTIYGVKLQKFKPPMDMETFVNRFEQYCLTQKIDINDKANLIIHALDDATFTVIQRELTETERTNYDIVKSHLLKRFDVHKEIGQKRLLFRQAKREATQTLEEFYTHLLGLAAKAFPDETADTVDRMITDQFIVGCEVDRTRLHLIEKGPRTSREALALGIAHQAAIKYNESLRDTSAVSAVEYFPPTTKSERPFYRGKRGNYYTSRVHSRGSRWNNNSNRSNNNNYNNYQQQYRSPAPSAQFQIGAPSFRSRGNNQRGSGRGPGRGRGRGQFYGQWNSGTNNVNEEAGRQQFSTNGISSPSCPLYINGIFESVEIPILLDTGSAVTVIDEEIWTMMKAKDDKLEKVPFAIRSVTQHDIEILGQKDINIIFPTRKKNGRRNFKVSALIAKGLLHKAILGLNFLKQFEAQIDVPQNKMTLFNQGTKSVHELFQGKGGYRSVSVVLAQDIVVDARTERRVQCKVTEDIEDGNVVYFEPKQEILQTKSIYVAGSVDVVNKGSITAQLINPTQEGVTLRRGTVVGKVEMMEEAVVSNIETEASPKSRAWLKKVDIVSPQVKKSSPITVDLRLGKGGAHITTARELRLLGVIFTFDLNWTAHADNTRKSINKMVGVINRLGNALNTNTRQRILQAFVMPKLTYCLPVWGRLCSKSNTAMDHTLLRAARVVLHNRTAELNKATFLSTDILPFSELATMRCLLAVHRILSDDDNSSYVPPLLARSGSQIITRNTTGRRFSIPKHRLTATEHCFYYNSSTIWNDLPLNVTTILGRNAFRTNLCNYILSKL